MKRFLIAFILGVASGVWGYHYFLGNENPERIHALGHSVVTNAERMGGAIQEKVGEIRTDDIKKEIEQGGIVVREKMRQAGGALSDATANARTTGAIKTKFFTEPGISALSINVDSSDGVVTLSGMVTSPEQVAKAIKLALETDGVQKVISTLQVKAKGS